MCLVSRPIDTIQQDCAFPTSNKQKTFTQCWYIVGPPYATLTQIVPALGECVMEPPSHIPAAARGNFDNHGQINDAVSLQPIHTPDLFIYINNDLI